MPNDYTTEAEALFGRFAERHGLIYDVETDVPIEVCWTFPEQPKLSPTVTLGLQAGDELNFGVGDFWSYFFPYERSEADFERILDAWMVGDARVAIMRGPGRLLQVREGDHWKAVYRASGCLFPLRQWPCGYLMNEQKPSAW